MDAKARRQLGAHYTADDLAAKLLRDLFLMDLEADLDRIEADRTRRRPALLREFLRELRQARIFDPACGRGDLLIAAYRGLRALEARALALLHATRPPRAGDFARVSPAQLFGIEVVEATLGLAATRVQQIDQACDAALGWAPCPPRAQPTLLRANALRIDWRALVPPGDDVIVVGNPPFVGKHLKTATQREDMAAVFADRPIGELDYAACWFLKAAEYCRHTRARCAFVATSSLCQGEQVPALWGPLFAEFGLKIHFAHRPFQWKTAERENAHVHVVVIGFGAFDREGKRIYEYAGDDARPACVAVENIGPYLTAGPDRSVAKRRAPLCPEAPEIRCGNKPSDGGHLILSDAERAELLRVEPGAAPLLRRFVGSEELLSGRVRWCLWLKDASPRSLRGLPRVRARIERVRAFRSESTAAPTRRAAERAGEFFYIAQPDSEYIAVPEVSSERRRYIPVGYLSADTIASNKLYVIAAPSLHVFGVLSSAMHMAWVRVVSGRLESRYQYSGSMVYNTFPWPAAASAAALARIEAAARAVLDARAAHPDCTLADLYDPQSMPAALARAHAALDRAVDRCYRRGPFTGDSARFEHLFARYEQLAGRPGE